MRTTYLFEVKVESEHDEETVKRVLDKIINAGLADASGSYERELNFDDDDEIACEMNIHAPVRIMIEG